MNTWKKIDNLEGKNLEVINPISTNIIEDTSKKTLLITEDAWLERNKKEKMEKLWTESSLLDVFRVTEKWEFEVKEESMLLKWHFPWTPLVPWVILKKLYKTITWIKLDDWNKSVSFDWMVIPWHKVVVKEDWVYLKEKNTTTLKENYYNIPFINEEEQTPTLIWPKYETDKKLEYLLIKNYPSDYLLQSDPILLAKSCILRIFDEKELNIWDEINWEIDSKMLDINWNLDLDFLSEWAAQVLSAWVSFIKNLWVNLENKWWDFEIMTFSSLLTNNFELPKNLWDKIIVEAITTKVDRREITAEYVIKDNNGNILQSWIISWRPVKKKLLDKNIEKLTNEINIEMLIEKSNKFIKESWLYNYLSVDKNKWKITIKSKINFKLLKSLYLDVYKNTGFAELNKEQFNTDICEWDVLDIRLDWLYRDWKEILKTPKKRLDENSKLREIFTVDRNRVIINPVFYSSFKTEEEYIKHINENIEIYLSELQIVLTQEKVKINWENATHKINNIYTPNQEVYFDENWIYSLENWEKKYYFMNDKILIIKNIIESNLEKYFSAYSNTEIKINSIDWEVKEWEIVLLKLAVLRLFKKIYWIPKTKLINDKLIWFWKIIKINGDWLYIDSEKIL